MTTDNSKELVLRGVHEILKVRITCFEETWRWIDYFFSLPNYDVSLLNKTLPEHVVLKYLDRLVAYIEENGIDDVEQFIRCDLSSGEKLRTVLHPVRVALTGKEVSLPLFESMIIMGVDTVLERLKLAGGLLSNE